MKIAIVGATGAVGREVPACLHRLGVPVGELRLLASERSAGAALDTPYGQLKVERLSRERLGGADFAVFSAGANVSRDWCPIAGGCGCTVVDNSSAFRLRPEVPLVVPEINGDCARGARLIANPNCTTAIVAVAVYPIYRAFGVERMIVASYQAASGAGARGLRDLEDQTRAVLDGRPAAAGVFAHRLAHNVIPHIDTFQDDGYTREEMKVAWETRKIFDDAALRVSCTAVRVPVPRVHCAAVTLETRRPVTPAAAREVLAAASGVELCDEPANKRYPMPLTATGKDAVQVGRVRQSLAFGERGLELFVAGDQLLKGAALNAVQIIAHLTAGTQ